MEINKIYNEDCLITMQKKGSSLDNACANVRYDEFDDCKTATCIGVVPSQMFN